MAERGGKICKILHVMIVKKSSGDNSMVRMMHDGAGSETYNGNYDG